ncbi:unnamed protein product [Oppiella nova]|uniref:EF-hand domain-containing protein n=1 Tax=Oppiella nova TaxID=334625 RepID=A0A7R9LVS8_9ACAR|nr:unnamed protein product [Oppiella nova]CAG2166744.1 unnamed protein product [Oppiella nova]
MKMFLKCVIFATNCLIMASSQDTHNTHKHHSNFLDPNLDHIREDVKEQYHIDLDSKTPEKELDFYYFQMHDFDNNLVLDGLEILTAMNHVIDEDYLRARAESTTTQSPNLLAESNDEEHEDPMEFYRIRERFRTQVRWNDKFDEDSKAIDKLLEEYDRDNDGFISYSEYIIARRQKH